ncbi:MAG: hypothetical protein VB021_06005 [Oscillospiraceae bacterium]|nr:hypothetical protein [Oscillospiraceae bacterium]
MKLTTREKRLLYLLLIVVILAAFTLAMQRLSAKNTARESELLSLQSESAHVRTACDSVGDMRSTLAKLEADNKTLQGRFEPYADNAQIDDRITALAQASGLTPYVLTLSDPANTPVPYFGAESTGEVGGLFWMSQASFTAYGSESALLAFLDAADADASLHVRSFSYTGPRTGTLQIQFVLDVYMYSPEAADAAQ